MSLTKENPRVWTLGVKNEMTPSFHSDLGNSWRLSCRHSYQLRVFWPVEEFMGHWLYALTGRRVYRFRHGSNDESSYRRYTDPVCPSQDWETGVETRTWVVEFTNYPTVHHVVGSLEVCDIEENKGYPVKGLPQKSWVLWRNTDRHYVLHVTNR